MDRRAIWAGGAAALVLVGAGLFWGVQSQAQDGVQAAFREARAGSPTPGSLSQQQEDWQRYRDEDQQAGQPVDDQPRIDWLKAIAARDAAAREARPTFTDLTATCVPMALTGCGVHQGGFLTVGNGQVLYWQLQEGATEENGITGAIVFLVPDGQRLRPVGWAADAARYEAPVLITEEGRHYVATSGIAAGSGSGNVDTIFRWTPGAERPLTEVDDWSWRDSLQAKLPQGLEVWKGVDWNWDNMLALTPLWRSSDGNCCATGGDAILNFSFDGDRLVLEDVNVRDSIVTAATSTPGDVLAYVARAQICAQYGDAGAADPDLPQTTRDRLAAARCDNLQADATALRQTHSDSPAVVDLIARAARR